MAETRKTPHHQAVYETIREMILLGRFAPGQALTIQGLADQLGVGMTPVREAIRRLTAEQALETLGNRRIVIPELDRVRLDEIYFLRLHVEPELARRATEFITAPEIATLEKIDAGINAAIAAGDVETYLERNSRFHFAIYARAGAPLLYRWARSLWVQAGPSLRVVCGRFGTSNLPDKHHDLIAALGAGDATRAADALREDLVQGLDLVRGSL